MGDDTVLVGTKCNRLIELNVRSWAMREIPFALRKSNPTVAQSILQDSTKCGIHSISVSPTGEYIATGSADPRHAVVLKVPSSRGKSASADYTHVQSMAVSPRVPFCPCPLSLWMFRGSS